MRPAPGTIRFLHGNRLERLADLLADAIASRPPPSPLAREVIVVPHPAMARWLERELSRRWGVAMALDFPLPGRFAWETVRAVLPAAPATSPFERGPLRWRLLARLDDFVDGPHGAVLAPIWRRASPAGRHALAERLARVYDEYLVQRPDWLAAWEQGRHVLDDDDDEVWQAALWRALLAGEASGTHRAALLDAAATALLDAATDATLPARVALFGLATLPLAQYRLLWALAQRIDVSWYFPNPCREYWFDLVSERQRARWRARAVRLGGPSADPHSEVLHPLLADWGRVAREFLEQRERAVPDGADDGEAWIEPEATTRLGWLQRGLLALDPLPGPIPPPDASLGFVAAATRLAEVEALHEALLAAFDDDPTLEPDDVVVMCPRLDDYAPLLRAVFGGSPAPRRIPFGIGERPPPRHAALIDAALRLLDLAQSRFGAGELMALAALPALSRRLDLDRTRLAALRQRLASAGIAFGYDAAHREALGAGRYDDGTWRLGLDRLLLGWALDEDAADVAGLAPLACGDPETALAIGRLDAWIEALADWARDLARARTAAEWAAAIRALWAEQFDPGDDEDERDALAALRQALAEWAAEVERGGAAGLALSATVVRAALAQRLEHSGARRAPFGPGVTICAMVPMRSVPFRVVAVLGLDDGAYPRRELERSFDLAQRWRRPADRALADDDRYLLLEALLSARQALWLSWTAAERSGGVGTARSALVDDLLTLLRRADPRIDDSVRREPGRAHDPARFAAEAPASRAAEWLDAARAVAGAPPPAAPPWPAPRAAPAPLALDDLLRFVSHPQRDIARRVLRLRPATRTLLDDADVLEPDALQRYALRAALDRQLAREPALGDDALARAMRLGGWLGPGAPARDMFDLELARVRALRATLPPPRPLPATPIALAGGRVVGMLPAAARAGQLVRNARWHGGDWLCAALLACARRAAGGDALDTLRWCEKRAAPQPARLEPDALGGDWLATLIEVFAAAASTPQPLFRHASWAYAERLASDGHDAALHSARDALWNDAAGRKRSESADPDTRLLLPAYGDDPLGATFQNLAQRLLLPLAGAIREQG